jgi:hypothetical protein
LHYRVDLLFDQTVDGRGSAGDERYAKGREKYGQRRRQARHRQEHSNHGAEDDELHHSRLGQRKELLEPHFSQSEGGHRNLSEEH